MQHWFDPTLTEISWTDELKYSFDSSYLDTILITHHILSCWCEFHVSIEHVMEKIRTDELGWRGQKHAQRSSCIISSASKFVYQLTLIKVKKDKYGIFVHRFTVIKVFLVIFVFLGFFSACEFEQRTLICAEAQELTVDKSVAALKVEPLVARNTQHIKDVFLFFFLLTSKIILKWFWCDQSTLLWFEKQKNSPWRRKINTYLKKNCKSLPWSLQNHIYMSKLMGLKNP